MCCKFGWTCGVGSWKWAHGDDGRRSFNDVVVKVEVDLEVMEGIAAKDDIVTSRYVKDAGVKLREDDVSLELRQAFLGECDLLVGGEFSGHGDT